MARTVEHIQQCFREGASRVSRGMPSWQVHLPLKALLEAPAPEGVQKGSAAHAAHVARGIFDCMTAVLPKNWRDRKDPGYCMDLEELFEYFEQADEEMFQIDAKNHGEDPLDLLDERMEDLYDWADRYRVWIG